METRWNKKMTSLSSPDWSESLIIVIAIVIIIIIIIDTVIMCCY